MQGQYLSQIPAAYEQPKSLGGGWMHGHQQ